MDASLVVIGTRADATNVFSISSNHRASILLSIHRYSAADGDKTERLASPSPRRRSTSGGDEAAAIEPGTRFQVSDFNEQPGTDKSETRRGNDSSPACL